MHSRACTTWTDCGKIWYKEDEKIKIKREGVRVARARAKMGAGKEQPGIKDSFFKLQPRVSTQLTGTALDVHSVWDGRSCWKSSQADISSCEYIF